jgi:hypothetical protein
MTAGSSKHDDTIVTYQVQRLLLEYGDEYGWRIRIKVILAPANAETLHPMLRCCDVEVVDLFSFPSSPVDIGSLNEYDFMLCPYCDDDSRMPLPIHNKDR